MANNNNKEEMLGVFEEDFTCGICLELFNREDRNPKVLPCAHSICYGCLIKCAEYNEAKKYGDDRFRCPLCNQKILLRPAGVKKLPTNVDKMQLMEKIIARSGTATAEVTNCKKSSTDSCKKHTVNASHYCDTCDEYLCGECVSLSLTTNEHANHKVALIEKSLAAKVELLMKAKDVLTEVSHAMLKKATEDDYDFDKDVEEVKNQLRKTTSDLHTKLDEWENESLEKLNEAAEERKRLSMSRKDMQTILNKFEEKLVKAVEETETECNVAYCSRLLKITKNMNTMIKSYKPVHIKVRLAGAPQLTLGSVSVIREERSRGQTMENLCSQLNGVLSETLEGKSETGSYDGTPSPSAESAVKKTAFAAVEAVGGAAAAMAAAFTAAASRVITADRDLPLAEQIVHMVAGARVTRGPDWPIGLMEDGGAGGVGTVTQVDGYVVSIWWERTGMTGIYLMKLGDYQLRLA